MSEAEMNHNVLSRHIINLPTELLLNIYAYLSNLSDAASLAETCGRLRHIWNTHTNEIYHSIAPRSLACEPQALHLAIVQQRTSESDHADKITPQTILTILKNERKARKSMADFQRKITSQRNRRLGYHAYMYRCAGAYDRRKMTKGEKRRFLRSYYRYWSLLVQGPSLWDTELDKLTVKEFYLLEDISRRWTGHYSPEVRDDITPSQKSYYSSLDSCIARHINAHGHCCSLHPLHDKEDEIWGYVALLLPYQPDLKMLCVQEGRSAEYVKRYLWEDSEEEEVEGHPRQQYY